MPTTQNTLGEITPLATCPSCQREIQETNKACPHCGARLFQKDDAPSPLQPANSVFESNKSRKHKHWGIGLVFLGLCLELSPLLFESPGLFNQIDPVLYLVSYLLGMLFSVVGLALYAKVQKSHSLSVWAAMALTVLVPRVGQMVGLLLLLPIRSLLPTRSRLAKTGGWVLAVTILAGTVYVLVWNFGIYGGRARQADAKVGLGAIHTAVLDWKATHNTYEISDISQLGYTPKEHSRYSFWYAVNGVPTIFPGSRPTTTPCDLTNPPTTVVPSASATTFVAVAKGSIGPGGSCDEWSISEDRKPVNTLNAFPGPVEYWMRRLGLVPKD
jgi:hypothetical protein